MVKVLTVHSIPYETGIEKTVKLSAREKKQYELEMRKFARSFLDINFDLLITIPIKIDARLSKTNGSFHFRRTATGYEPIMIKLSERFVLAALKDDEGVEAILDVLSHELIHYALCVLELPFNDGDEVFEKKLAELGVRSSGATPETKKFIDKKNVWYRVVDVYQQGDKISKYMHARKTQDWLGVRKEIRYEKLIKQ